MVIYSETQLSMGDVCGDVGCSVDQCYQDRYDPEVMISTVERHQLLICLKYSLEATVKMSREMSNLIESC